MRLQLTFAAGNYDFVRPLADGSVKPDGIDLVVLSGMGSGDQPRSPASAPGRSSRKAASASSMSTAISVNAAPHADTDMPPCQSSTNPTASGPTKPPT